MGFIPSITLRVRGRDFYICNGQLFSGVSIPQGDRTSDCQGLPMLTANEYSRYSQTSGQGKHDPEGDFYFFLHSLQIVYERWRLNGMLCALGRAGCGAPVAQIKILCDIQIV